MSPQILFGVCLTSIQALLLLPLLVHAYRTREHHGVSLSGEAAWTAGGLGWLSYGVLTDSPILVASGALAFLGSFLFLALTRRSASRMQQRSCTQIAVGISLALATSYLLCGTPGFSVALAVFGVLQFVPQAMVSQRLHRAGLPGVGVSARAAVLRAVYCGSWAAYAALWAIFGVADYDLPLIAWGIAGGLTFSLQALVQFQFPDSGERPVVTHCLCGWELAAGPHELRCTAPSGSVTVRPPCPATTNRSRTAVDCRCRSAINQSFQKWARPCEPKALACRGPESAPPPARAPTARRRDT